MQPIQRICVVIARTRHKMVAVEIQEAARVGVPRIEIRLDYLARSPDFKRLLANKPCELIATVRRPSDGGRYSGTEEARKVLLRQAIVNGFDWIDLETDIADEIRRFGSVKRIVSYHNFTGTPADLEAIYERMLKQDADILKLAVTAQTPGDNLRLLKLLAQAPKPTLGHCMGDIGFPSRILALRLPQVPFIYAAFNRDRGIAPGLPSLDELRNTYLIDRINADTRVYGVIGDPIAHSYSPLLHNAAFQAAGINALYLPFRVPRDQLPTFLTAFQALPVSGYSVTIPHKEAAVTVASVRDNTVELTGSANTLLPEANGWRAFNTDYPAILDSLDYALRHRPKIDTEDALDPPPPEGGPETLSGRAALVLGAGGVARSLAHALRHQGLNVIVSARTLARAQQLAGEVQGKAVDWGARHSVKCDVLVNGTPVGMHPNVDESPIHPSFLRPALVVFDTVYNPETTLLLKEARARGAIAITGVDMFVRQAAWQFRHFTGQDAPLELMRQTMRRALSPLTARTSETESPSTESSP